MSGCFITQVGDREWWCHPHKRNAQDCPCGTCEQIAGGFGPSHDGSTRCQSGSIASGGPNAHCTCDTCF